MPRLCSQCKHYSTTPDETECPKCNVPMQFTLLGAPGAQPEPLAGIERPQQQQAAATWDSFDLFDWIQEHRIAIGIVGIPILVGVLSLLGMALGGGRGHAFDRLQIGMSADEVEKIVSQPVMRRRSWGPGEREPLIGHPDQVLHLNDQMVLTFRNYVLVDKQWVGPPRK